MKVKSNSLPKCGHFNITDDCKYCLKMLSKYDEVLAKDGFDDIEERIGGEPVLKQYSSNVYRQAPQVVRENKLIYYETISKNIKTETFLDEVELLVMTRISEGIKIKDICSELKKLKERSYRATIRYIIRKYENKWSLKKWKPEQMQSTRTKK